jgi:hypothetical protein
MWSKYDDRHHDWDWKLHRDRTPSYGVCLKCGAEKHWDKERRKWGAAMLNEKRVPLCAVKGK